MSELSPTPKPRKRRTTTRKKAPRKAELATVPAKTPLPERLGPLMKDAEDYVRREPLKALAGAAVAGLLLPRLPVTMLLGLAARIFLKSAKPSILALAVAEAAHLLRDRAPEPRRLN